MFKPFIVRGSFVATPVTIVTFRMFFLSTLELEDVDEELELMSSGPSH